MLVKEMDEQAPGTVAPPLPASGTGNALSQGDTNVAAEGSASPHATAEATDATTTASGEVSSSDEQIARRRRRRRRRRTTQNDTPSRKVQMGLLAVVALLLFVAISGSELRQSLHWVRENLIPPGTGAALRSAMRFEVGALILAGLIILYLMPGVEDRVLRTLGLRKEKRRSSR